MRKVVLAALAATILGGVAHASSLVVDRGLPTANLNNAAGANRSNVAWGAGTDGSIVGDTFTLGGSASSTYTIDTIRTWVIARDGVPLSATLYTGTGAGANLTTTSTAATFTPVTYANMAGYETTTGTFRSIYAIDFTGLNIVAAGGTTISFAVDGLNQGGYGFFNHASNAALSGSPQDSADNVMSYYLPTVGGATYAGAYNSNGDGWDKSSDINVQVYADVTAPVPEPASWAMMIAGFGLVGAAMRRQKVAVRFA